MSIDPKRLYQEGLAQLQAGRGAVARPTFEQVVKAAPNAAEPQFQLARCLAAEGDLAGAEALLRRALKASPRTPAIWQALHGVLRGGAAKKLEREAQKARIPLGSDADIEPILKLVPREPAQAETQALALIKLAPMAAPPAYALGLARLALGKSAIAPLQTALDRDPSMRRARVALARACFAEGQPTRAEALLDGLDGPEAAIIKARILRETARPEAAVEVLQSQTPDARVLADLALSLAACGQGDAAREALDQAVGKGADRVALSRAVAFAAEEAGDVGTAEAILDAALTAVPTAALLTHRAQLAQSAGDSEVADDMLQRAIAADPSYGEAYRSLANGRKVSDGDPVVGQMHRALDRSDLHKSSRAALHFAASKAAFDQRRDADVMAHLNTANRLMAGLYPYGFETDLTDARRLVQDWTRLRDMPAAGPTDRVIFVTGLPRSGTTLVETILAAHSEVLAGGEMPFLNRSMAPALEALAGDGDVQAAFGMAGERYLASARRRVRGEGVIIDKTIATFSRMGHALTALPGAKVVLVRRDARDVGLSLYRNQFPDGLHRYAYDLGSIGRYIRLHDALVAFWQDALPDRVHVVDYEALTQDPEGLIRALLNAVDLPWEAACLSPEATGRRIQTLSFAQARQPISTGSIALWQRFEAELGPLIEALETSVDVVQ